MLISSGPYKSKFLSMYLNSLKLVLVYSTPKLFHKCIVLRIKEDWKESVLAKGILKEF